MLERGGSRSFLLNSRSELSKANRHSSEMLRSLERGLYDLRLPGLMALVMKVHPL